MREVNLSPRALRYLRARHRDKQWMATREEVVDFFKKQRLPVREELINIQTNYSGYVLSIKNAPGSSFILSFVSRQQIEQSADLSPREIGNGYLLRFGHHKTAPFGFFITDAGQICTYGVETSGRPNIICSSVEKYIEQYALMNELAAQFQNPYYHDVADLARLDGVLRSEFTQIAECSDAYSYWCTNKALTVEKGTLLSEPKFYLHVYGQNQGLCDRFIERMMAAGIIV